MGLQWDGWEVEKTSSCVHLVVVTVKILKFRTPKTFAVPVITLKV